MKAVLSPVRWMCLMLLLGVSAWPYPLPSPWNAWLLPVLAVLSLAVCLPGRTLPWQIGVSGGAVLMLIAVYAWNPTHRWNEGVGLLPVDPVRWLPGSAFPAGTWTAWGLAVAMWAVFALAFHLSERQVRGVQMAMMAVAVAMAFMVLVQRLEPNHSRIFTYTGIFVNENHFAVLINMILPLVLAMVSRFRFRAIQEGRPSSPAGLFLLAAVLMGASVVMCRSRAGIAVMALLVLAHVVMTRRLIRQYPFMGIPASPWLRVLGGGAVLVVAMLAVAAFAREWSHWADIAREWEFRLGIVKDTLGAWRETPVWGIGPGAFTEVFPYYQSGMFQGRVVLHAHCEPIQFLAEFGMAGGVWMMGAVVLALTTRNGTRVRSTCMPPFADLERHAFALGLWACALHSLVDFPLRIPLLALLAATWAGVWAGHRPMPVDPQEAEAA